MLTDIWEYLGKDAHTMDTDNPDTIINYFLAHPQALNQQDDKGNTPFHLVYLCSSEDYERFMLCRWFLEQGASVTIQNHIGRDMLYYIERNPTDFCFHYFDTFEKTLDEAKNADKAYLGYLLIRSTSSYPENFNDLANVHAVLKKHDMLFLITTLLTDFKLNSMGMTKRIQAYLSYPEYQTPDLNAFFLYSLGASNLACVFSEQFQEERVLCSELDKILTLNFTQAKEHYLFIKEFANTLNQQGFILPVEVAQTLLKTIHFDDKDNSKEGLNIVYTSDEYLDIIYTCPTLHRAYLDVTLSDKKTKVKSRKI